ncbi:DUF5309 family protein [Lysinibacillus sp. GbtcB16]|uniref:SU10 major capsid protein n=1 Tax=Lysinibacillus sp. GbtcB16 TaxID=2824761 RepID=UPI001C2FDDA7|nr:DUF5309 family protein [Lysinibacillus sp. GbtcB16]
MFKSNNFQSVETINVSKELAVLAPQMTPLTTLLMSKGNFEKATSTLFQWLEKKLSADTDYDLLEGADITKFQQSRRRTLNNVQQIFARAVAISGTADAMKNGRFTEEIQDRLLELKLEIERVLINGVFDDGSTGNPRKMKGLIEWVEASNEFVFTNNPLKLIKDGMEKLFTSGVNGGDYYLLASPAYKEMIDDALAGVTTYTQKETTFGSLVSVYVTNFGNVNIMISRDVPKQSAILFNDAYLSLAPLREAQVEALAKTGDSNKAMVIAETTLRVGSPEAVVLLTDEAIKK